MLISWIKSLFWKKAGGSIPDNLGLCILYNDGRKHVALGYRKDGIWKDLNHMKFEYNDLTVTHYFILPNPPKST